MKSFNLIDEPWIPVKTHDGKELKTSLMDVLVNAKAYACLTDTSPPNLIALYRLLLAIVHRAMSMELKNWTDKDRSNWFKNGFPQEAIKNYFKAYHERFWFFHQDYPFMQVPELANAEEVKSKELKIWTKVTLESSSGDTPLLFDHSSENLLKALPIGQAVRNSLGYLQFVPGGLVKILRISDKSGPLANTAAILPVGSNLAETLSLALHPFNQKEDDLPAWELPPPKIKDLMGKPTLVTGPNDRYTRLTRSLLWIPSLQEGYVHQLHFCEGLSIDENNLSPDPMASYRINKKGEAIRISYYDGRAIWRDLPSLVPDIGGKSSLPPAVMNWALNLYNSMGQWDQHVEILTSGIASDQAKLLRWRIDKIKLPQKIIKNTDAVATLKEELRRAEDFYSHLRRICISMIAGIMPESNHGETIKKARMIHEKGPGMSVYFSNVEKGLSELFQNITTGNMEIAYKKWSETLTLAAQNSWQTTCKLLGNSHLALRSEALAYPKFCGLLNKIKSNFLTNDMENKS